MRIAVDAFQSGAELLRSYGAQISTDARRATEARLIVKPYAKGATQRPIGYVETPDRIIGEWAGSTWGDVPRMAALYVNDPQVMRPMYESGEVESIWWKKPGRIRSLTGWRWWDADDNPHALYFLRQTLSRVPEAERFRAVHEFVQAIRDAGGGPGSPVGMLNGLLRVSLPEPLRESCGTIPVERLWRGSRIQQVTRVKAEYGPTDLWDLRAAFPTALRNVGVPRSWRHYEGRTDTTLPDTEAAYVRASVYVPWMFYGPLPDVGLHHPNFPVERMIRGIWPLSELREAEAVGCEVFVHEYWTALSFRHPFREWGRMVDELRATVGRDAEKLVKMAANRYVGKFAMDGHRERTRIIGGVEILTVENGRKKPDSLTIHGQVTGNVRAQLFGEGIAPYPAHFVFCHTDGVALDANAEALGHPPTARWQVKAYMERLLLINPMRYAYRPGAEDIEPGDWRYVVAGIPESMARPFFDRRWLKKPRPEADTHDRVRDRAKGVQDGQRARGKATSGAVARFVKRLPRRGVGDSPDA